MSSNIDPTKPTAGIATTASVRSNFLAAKNEIEQLQGNAQFVEHYGAVGDGVTDDSAAIQAALDAGGPVRFGAKTYYCAAPLKYQGITSALIGQGMDFTTIKFDPGIRTAGFSTGALIAPKNNVLGTKFNTFGITFDANHNTTMNQAPYDPTTPNGPGILSLYETYGAKIYFCRFTHMRTRGAIGANFETADVGGYEKQRGHIHIDNCIIEHDDGALDLPKQWWINAPPYPDGEYAGGGIMIEADTYASKGIYDIWITNNIFRDLSGSCCQVWSQASDDPSGQLRLDYYIDSRFENNIWEDLNDGGVYGPIPCELGSHTNMTFINNRMNTGTRGIGLGGIRNGVFSHNLVQNNFLAMEVGTFYNCILSDNVFTDCTVGIAWDGPNPYGNNGLKIVNNIFKGNPYGTSVWNTLSVNGPIHNYIHTGNNIGPWIDVDISYNSFYDIRYCDQAVITITGQNTYGASRNITCCYNTFDMVSEYSPITMISPAGFCDYVISHNIIKYSADFTPNNPLWNQSQPFIYVIPTATIQHTDYNIIMFTGKALSDLPAIGSNGAPSSGPIVCTINYNTFQGTFTAGVIQLTNLACTTVMVGNDYSNAVGWVEVGRGGITSGTYRIQNTMEYSVPGGIPTTGNWQRGDKIWNAVPTIGQPIGYACNTRGTFGTLGAGKYGTVASGSYLMTMNNVSGLTAGQFVMLSGNGRWPLRVCSISGSVVRVDFQSDATVTSGKVDFINPVFVTMGNYA